MKMQQKHKICHPFQKSGQYIINESIWAVFLQAAEAKYFTKSTNMLFVRAGALHLIHCYIKKSALK